MATGEFILNVKFCSGVDVTSGSDTPDVSLKADTAERLVPPLAHQAENRRTLIFAAGVHLLLLALLFFVDLSLSWAPKEEQEIPVELVAEMPPEPTPEAEKTEKKEPAKPRELQQDLVTPPTVKPKPPPDQVKLEDVPMAVDAPKFGNDNKTLKGEPEKETKGPRVATPPKLIKPQPTQDKPEEEKAVSRAEEKAPTEQSSEPLKPADDTPDAEALDKAQIKPPTKPQIKSKAKEPSKDLPVQGHKQTVAQQLAALAPAPSYSFSSSAKSAPIGGGTEKASYESLLLGLIKRRLHIPPGSRASHLILQGAIFLSVDSTGNLTHQAVFRGSGDPSLDAACLAAVRQAAPFPAPPRGLAESFIWGYSNQE